MEISEGVIHRGRTSIDVKLLIDSSCLLANLGDKGLFSSANIFQIAEVVRRALFLSKSSPIPSL